MIKKSNRSGVWMSYDIFIRRRSLMDEDSKEEEFVTFPAYSCDVFDVEKRCRSLVKLLNAMHPAFIYSFDWIRYICIKDYRRVADMPISRFDDELPF